MRVAAVSLQVGTALWIAGTNPAVSMPELARIRKILVSEDCFVVVSDGYTTETTRRRGPAGRAVGEKTGTYTNTDRTVHLSEQAVDPPGSARSDLDIWLGLRPPPRPAQQLRAPAAVVVRPTGGLRGVEMCQRGPAVRL